MPNRLLARFLMWHVVVYALMLGVGAVIGHKWLDLALQRHHDHQLQELADRIAAGLADKALDQASVATSVRNSGVESIVTPVFVRNEKGELIYASPILQSAEPEVGRQAALVQAAANGPAASRFVSLTFHESERARFISVPIQSRAGYVQVGILLGDVNGWLHSVEFWSVLLIPALVALAALGTWIIAGRLLASGPLR